VKIVHAKFILDISQMTPEWKMSKIFSKVMER